MKPLILALALAVARSAGAVPTADDPLADRNGQPLPETSLSGATLSCLILSDDECGKSADAGKVISREGAGVKFAAPIFGLNGNFERLWDSYPHGSVGQVKTTIGRDAEAWIINTCVIRVSYALNLSRIPEFKIDRSFIGAEKKVNFIPHKVTPYNAGIQNAVLHRDFAYLYRVDEMASYMLKKYGKPQVWARKGTHNLQQAVHGKRGIILFVVNGWANATGHFDLWDGQQAAHDQFFNEASDVFLWQ